MYQKLIQKFSGAIVLDMVLSTSDVKKFKDKYQVNVLHTNCDVSASEDKNLPRNSYLVTCENEGEVWYDIVMGLSADIFDAYYDTFGDVIRKLSWTSGTINPKLWGVKPKESNKKR